MFNLFKNGSIWKEPASMSKIRRKDIFKKQSFAAKAHTNPQQFGNVLAKKPGQTGYIAK